MNALQERMCEWFARGHRVVVATIVGTSGSAPFGSGTMMAVNDGGELFGTISNGCVEGAVAQLAREVFSSGSPTDYRFASNGDGLTDVALLCGGQIDVRIEEIDQHGVPGVFAATPIPIRLIVAGAGDYARALSEVCALLDYEAIVVDPRPAFALAENFPHALVRCAWPDTYLQSEAIAEKDAILLLSHDTRYDAPFLSAALASAAFYVGAMGSRQTQQRRCERLFENGVSPKSVKRLHAPVGLDLGGRTPQESAIAILAEIIAVRNCPSGDPLRETPGPIHNPHHDTAMALPQLQSVG